MSAVTAKPKDKIMTAEEAEALKATIEEMKKDAREANEAYQALKKKVDRQVYLKVSEKGGASLYGIRRFPITFYVEEWNKVLDMEEEIREFLAANADKLTTKKDNGES